MALPAGLLSLPSGRDDHRTGPAWSLFLRAQAEAILACDFSIAEARPQIDTLNAAGCRRIVADKQSGKNDLCPELKACMAFINPGDTLVVPSLDRLSRSLKDLVNNVADLRGQTIGFMSVHGNLDTTPGGRPALVCGSPV
jgi:DNA invertase Pin-like site-specific DNA recombinase